MSTRRPSTTATAPRSPTPTIATGTVRPRISAAASGVSAPVSTRLSRRSISRPAARSRSFGRRPANARASSSPTLTYARAPLGTTSSWLNPATTAVGASAATSAARARAPGSYVTIARWPSSGSTIVTGVRVHGVPTICTPSASISSRIISPAGSRAIGDASATLSPSRAAPIAVIAPPPGERTRSPAKRSSPSRGSASRPTKVMSRNAGTATTTSTLMDSQLSGSAATQHGEAVPQGAEAMYGLGAVHEAHVPGGDFAAPAGHAGRRDARVFEQHPRRVRGREAELGDVEQQRPATAGADQRQIGQRFEDRVAPPLQFGGALGNVLLPPAQHGFRRLPGHRDRAGRVVDVHPAGVADHAGRAGDPADAPADHAMRLRHRADDDRALREVAERERAQRLARVEQGRLPRGGLNHRQNA